MIVPTTEDLSARLFELERRITGLESIVRTMQLKFHKPLTPGGLQIEIKHDQGPNDKPVELTALSSQMVLATLIIASHFQQYTGILTITSGFEGTHSGKSLHYRGFALDYRTRHINPKLMRELAAQIEVALAHQFDVILKETSGQKHLHVEYDPWGSGQNPKDVRLFV